LENPTSPWLLGSYVFWGLVSGRGEEAEKGLITDKKGPEFMILTL